MTEILRRSLPGKVSPTGLQLRSGLSFEEWKQALEVVARFANTSVWLVADAVNYGFWSYGKKYEQALEVTGLAYGTLRNYAYVAGRFDYDRRRASLSFRHHEKVAALLPEEQNRWLDRAERERLSSDALGQLLREEFPKPATSPAAPAPEDTLSGAPDRRPDLEQITLTVEAERAERWAAAAAAAGLPLPDWAIAVLDAAA